MTGFRPLPADYKLDSTLSRRLAQLREFRNLTIQTLSETTRLSAKRLEEIEAGMETWLSFADRQVLAKALTVDPSILLEVERRPSLDSGDIRKTEDALAQKILQGGRDLECPKCGSNLNCRVEQAFDLEGKIFQIAKAFCVKCRFVIR